LESKKNIPEPEMTSEGKFKCRADNQEYDNREDYESHCMEDHSSDSSSSDMTEDME
jgi:hypothetical protein